MNVWLDGEMDGQRQRHKWMSVWGGWMARDVYVNR